MEPGAGGVAAVRATPAVARSSTVSTEPVRKVITKESKTNTVSEMKPTSGAGGLALGAEVSLDYLQQNWPKILLELGKLGKRQMGLLLNQSQPVQWQGGALSIQYPSERNGNYKFLSENYWQEYL